MKAKNIKETPRNLSKTAEKSARFRNKDGASKYFAPFRVRKNIIEELEDLFPVKKSLKKKATQNKTDNLDPEFWENGILRPNISKVLKGISDKFIKFLSISSVPEDIILTGSFVTNTEGSIDIHVLLDFSKLDQNSELMLEFFITKMALWNFKYNVKFKGRPVEFYVENIGNENAYRFAYSIIDNVWIRRGNGSMDVEGAYKKAYLLMEMIDIITGIGIEDNKLKKIEVVIKKLLDFKSNNNENSSERLAFNLLKNNGYIKKLSDLKSSTTNRMLSLEEGFDRRAIINEEEKPKYKYGCLMIGLTVGGWNELKDAIDENDLFIPGEQGFEDYPHITILYGFHPGSVQPKKLKQFTDQINRDSIMLELSDVSIFENDKFDVLKFGIDDIEGTLNKLNNAVKSSFKNTNKFPDYIPHATIAYLKKGMGKKYVEKFKDLGGIQAECRKMVFSIPEGQKFFWMLNNNKNILELAEPIEGMDDKKLSVIQDFISFCKTKLDIKNRIFVSLRNGRDEYIKTTAAYSPSEDKNYIRCSNRALVDILRSIGHELVHNKQREAGVFKIGDEVQNIGGAIEDAANSIAGVLIKDFTHNYGYDFIYD